MVPNPLSSNYPAKLAPNEKKNLCRHVYDACELPYTVQVAMSRKERKRPNIGVPHNPLHLGLIQLGGRGTHLLFLMWNGNASVNCFRFSKSSLNTGSCFERGPRNSCACGQWDWDGCRWREDELPSSQHRLGDPKLGDQ